MKPITIKILSIDFDYFIDAPIEVRNNIFPNGADMIPEDKLQDMWKEVYLAHPEVRDIGLIDQFEPFLQLIKERNFQLNWDASVFASHSKIYDKVIKQILPNTPLEVYNIDFHHDMYYSDNKVNCSNWARIMLEEYPNAKYSWFRRIDSERQTLFGEVDCYHSPFMPVELPKILPDIDFVFLCESPEWTPPHLHQDYLRLVRALNN